LSLQLKEKIKKNKEMLINKMAKVTELVGLLFHKQIRIA
jgi:hypothetical protein